MKKNLIFSAASLLFLWLVWLIAAAAVKNEYILPPFGAACSAAGRLLVDAAFWRAFGNTFLRTVVAFLASALLGVGLALVADLHPFIRAFFAPVVSVLRTVPTMAVILILLLWTSPSAAPVIVALLVLFPAFYAATLAAVDDVKARYGELAEAFRISAGRRIFQMVLPLSAPSVLGQAGSILSMGLKITISGEVLSNTFRSLGGMMQEAKMFVEMPTLMALTLLSVVVGFLLEACFALLKRLVVRWRE